MLFSAPAKTREMGDGLTQALLADPLGKMPLRALAGSDLDPARIQLITADQIRRSRALDVPGLLREVADLDLSRYAGPRDDKLSLTRHPEPASPPAQILVNGRSTEGSGTGVAAWSLLPLHLSEVQQVEVVRPR
jgi:iron complex outermembrane receptor protein